ncbi:neuron navigator 3-like [Scylla paramamosain]|uniref:neuron navigator 3-like n=1 Tax=Scylla paramamosain TaxID=85552 RepID=UPI003083AFA0
MSDLGFMTIPRGRRLPQIPTTITTNTLNNNNNNHNHNNNNNNNLKNGYFKNFSKNGYCFSNIGGGGGGGGGGNLKTPVIPIVNGGGGGGGGHLANGCTGRAVHDGFATIRAGGKRGRSYSSPTVTQDTSTASQCSHGCCGPGGGRGWTMEPLWEERGEGGTPAVSRRDRPQLPWWEVATRRSRYRSCPAFSQASVVTALEQTMNSVTSTLERLASSPDLKETEAAEIRKTAAVLRQQSSAVCQSVSSGYISLERQLSCDSVSSVTSTVSATSLSSYASLGSHSLTPSLMPHCNAHHNHPPQDAINASPGQAKLKKRSWLRSSFRRAFGRQGRKLTKQQQNELGSPSPGSGQGSHSILNDLPLHHTVNTAVRHLPAPPVPPHQYSHQLHHQPPPPYSASLPRKSHSSSGLLGTARRSTLLKRSALEDKEEEVKRLREEVTAKERTLTDCRLELLSAQHQMQGQADTIARLQAEVAALREENLRLVGVLKGQKGPAVDQVLPTLTHTLTSLAISPSPISRTNSIHHEDGHMMKVVVVMGGPARPSPTTHTPTHSLDPSLLTHIGNITVGCKTTWEQLDTMVVNMLKDYGNSIDPVSALGLDASALDSYQVEEVVCGPDLPRPELLPYGYCVGDVDAVLVWLKDASHKKDGEVVGNVSSSALASLTPAATLRHLASLLVEHRRLVLAGPPAVGKTSLAHTLARFFVVNAGHVVTEEAVKVFRVTGSNSLDLCQLLANTWPRGVATSSILGTTTTTTSPAHPSLASPLVLVLDDLHVAGGVVETLKRYLPSALHSGPAIIATCCPSTALSTRLHIHCNFKWAALSPQQEPVRGLLGRVLRRRVAAAEAAANTRLPDAHHLAEWLARLWLHLNTLLTGHCGGDAALGPGLLLDCPLGQEETQAWFLEVWNGCLVPHLLAAMRGAAPHPPSLAQSWTDPLDWVLATYPWPNSVASGPDHLTRILVSDVLSLVSSSSNNNNNNNNNSSSDSPSTLACLTSTTSTTTTTTSTSALQNNTYPTHVDQLGA